MAPQGYWEMASRLPLPIHWTRSQPTSDQVHTEEQQTDGNTRCASSRHSLPRCSTFGLAPPQHPDTREMTKPGQPRSTQLSQPRPQPPPGSYLMRSIPTHRSSQRSPIRWGADGSRSSSPAKAGSKARSHPHQLVLESRELRGNNRSQMFEQLNLPETESYLLQTRQERKSFQKGMGEPVRVNPRWPPASQAAGQLELYPERLETALSHID